MSQISAKLTYVAQLIDFTVTQNDLQFLGGVLMGRSTLRTLHHIIAGYYIWFTLNIFLWSIRLLFSIL